MPKAMIITVGTGRNREDIAHCIRFSIAQHNPEYVLFVATKKSEEETLPIVLKDNFVKNYKIKLLTNEDDVEQIYIECAKFIQEINYKPEDVAIDYTSGTKAMSAGLIYAGLQAKINTVIYVTGKRDEGGRVIPGTERIYSFEPNRTYTESLFEEAVNLFNRCQFDTCLEIVNQAGKLTAEPEFQNKIQLLKMLAQAYSFWDKFNLSGAFSLLKEVSNEQLLSDWKIKNQIERNKQILYKECENKFCHERIVDLFENSKRRLQEHKYDDAIARIYRLLEYIGQFFCAKEDLYVKNDKGEIDTSKINKEKLPVELQSKYKETLELAKTFNLLSDLNHSIGTEIYKEISSEHGKLKKLLTIRNSSILAHGFQPIEESDCKEFISFMEDLLKRIINNFLYLQKCAEFPKIKF